MLYELWRHIARQRAHELALWELAAGRRWSFEQLARAAEQLEPSTQPMVFAQGHNAQFLLAVLQAWRDGRVLCPLEADQPAPRLSLPPQPCTHLKLTSATSGAAKVIAFTEQQLLADARTIVATMGLRAEWPNLGAISLAHSYGFSNLVLPLLLEGIPLLLAPSALPEVVRQAAQGQSALTLAAVPALWRAWHQADAIPAATRLAISAGAPLSLQLEQTLYSARALKVHNFYGSSECGAIAYDSSLAARSEEGLVGQAVQGVEFSLSPQGCLQVKSQAVGQTYWPEPNPALSNGCFQTSDLAELRASAVYLRGRLGDLINVAGRKVWPEAIELTLRAHPAVQDCLVFGVAQAQNERSERIVACVVAPGLSQPEPLKQFLLERLPSWQVPRHWWFVDSLGLNGRGKISRADWKQQYAARFQ